MNEVLNKFHKCYESIKDRIPFTPKVALVLGSGLGDYANKMNTVSEIPYETIEDFPVSTVPGHEGKYIFGYVGDVPVVCMKGRVHFYEGYKVSDVILPIRLMNKMGAGILFLTNAAGGLQDGMQAGDFMLVTDQISLFAPNPLIGPSDDEFGVRFPDMTHVYDIELNDIIRDVCKKNNIELKEGVYTQVTGPSFESPAEIRMLKTLGTDAVGMSTIVEAIAAHNMGMRICCISSICNLAAGISPTPLSHKEVQEAGIKAAPIFENIVSNSIKAF